jgi:hypothetical protein
MKLKPLYTDPVQIVLASQDLEFREEGAPGDCSQRGVVDGWLLRGADLGEEEGVAVQIVGLVQGSEKTVEGAPVAESLQEDLVALEDP